jgi:hypothetical protein
MTNDIIRFRKGSRLMKESARKGGIISNSPQANTKVRLPSSELEETDLT